MYGTCGGTGGDETDGIVAYGRSSTTSVGLMEKESERELAIQPSDLGDGRWRGGSEMCDSVDPKRYHELASQPASRQSTGDPNWVKSQGRCVGKRGRATGKIYIKKLPSLVQNTRIKRASAWEKIR